MCAVGSNPAGTAVCAPSLIAVPAQRFLADPASTRRAGVRWVEATGLEERRRLLPRTASGPAEIHRKVAVNFGAVEWLTPEQVDETYFRLLPTCADEITIDEIAELTRIFGKDGEMAAERLS